MHPWAHWLQHLEAIGRTRGMNGSKKNRTMVDGAGSFNLVGEGYFLCICV
jgi:hypothetical protein